MKKIDSIDFVLRFALIFYTLMLIGLTSCSVDEFDDITIIPTITLDGRLPMDSNGYYHLQLNSNTNQTTHRITGSVLNTTEPTKVTWDSNLVWEHNGEVVPTINSTSYVTESGEINTMIAPIYGMITDTLRVKATINEWNIIQTLNIVLE